MNTIHSNKYPSRCARCCARVDAGAGVLSQVLLLNTYDAQNTRATLSRAVYCAICAEHRNQTALPPAGHYAVHDKDGKLQFFKFARYPKIVTRDLSRPLPAFVRPFCKLVHGGNPDHEISGAFAAELVTRALENPAGAALRYAQELGRCSRCNRHLTDEASRARGLGPECAERTN